MGKYKYIELDFIITSLQTSIDEANDVFIQIIWFVELVIASYFKNNPNIIDDLNIKRSYVITANTLHLADYSAMWRALYKYRNKLCHAGLRESARELRTLLAYRGQLLEMTTVFQVNLNWTMLDNFVKRI